MKSFSTRVFFLGSTFAASFAAGSACHFEDKNEDHCVRNEGDAYCREKHDDDPAFAFCGGACVDSVDDDGCVASMPADESCYSPCGGNKYADEDDSCVGASTETDTNASDPTGDPSGDPTTNTDSSADTGTSTLTSGETETTDPTGTTGPQGCQNSGECTNPAEPVCLDNECVPCTDTPDGDTACTSKDANFPVCNDDGQCVQCNAANDAACTDTTPVCDAGTSTCVGCKYHEQCPDSACRIATGECFDAAEVYDVGAGQTYATLTDAQDELGIGAQVVLMLHDGVDFNESIVLSGAGTAYAFLAAPGSEPQWVNTSVNAPTLQVTTGAEAYVQDVRLTGNLSAEGIAIDSASVWLDRAELVQNSGGGVSASTSSNVTLRNTIIGGNGSGAGPTRGLSVASSTVQVLYSTIARNDSDTEDDSLFCDAPATVTVRNSILVGRDSPSIACDADISTSALDQDVAGNLNIGPINNAWFDSVGMNLFTLSDTGGTAFADIAEWLTGDPAEDFDGTPRPDVDMTPDVAGADIP